MGIAVQVGSATAVPVVQVVVQLTVISGRQRCAAIQMTGDLVY